MSTIATTTTSLRSFDLPSRKAQRQLLLFAVLVSDVLSISLASTLAYLFRFLLGLEIFETVAPSVDFYLRMTAVLIPIWVFLYYQSQLYNLHYMLGGTREYAVVLNASTLGLMLLTIAMYFGRVVIARGWIVLFWVFSIVVVGACRFGLRRLAYAMRRRGYLRTTTLIVGGDEEGRAIANQLREAQTCGADVIGFVDDLHSVGERIGGLPVLGQVSQLQEIVKRHQVEEVLLSTAALARPQVLSIYQAFGTHPDVELRLSPGLFEIMTTGARVKEWGYVPLVSINKVRLSELETWLKTATDYGLTLVALVLLWPILLLLAVAVKWDSPGPVLYRRRVVGRGGREMDAFKFRTMRVNGDEILSNHPELQAELRENQKLKDDPRVTYLGRFLRKYSLDELPQLFNVLLGQMSLVGPRMISPAEAEKYGKWKLNLLTVKPGITGMWQISGRSDVSYEERIRLDMHYIRNYSFWLDFMILFRTIPVVLKGRGAY
jgi:exopolysaccharide biosynthesis polyprenyl glycosylphosphotransferase